MEQDFSTLYEIWGCDNSWSYPQRITVAYSWREALAEKADCERYGYSNVEVRERAYLPDLVNWDEEWVNA